MMKKTCFSINSEKYMFIFTFADIPVCVYQSMSLIQTGMTPFGLKSQ